MATITDVARLAGVSHQTVSRVINAEDTVRAVTKARVDAAIRELGYRPNAAARALARRKTRTIGLVTTGGGLFGPSSTMSAFNQAAREAGYQVTIASLASSDRAGMVEAVEGLLGQDVEALVVIVADYSTFDVLRELDVTVPLIAAASGGHEGLISVSIDQYEGARLAVRHLIGLGHRHILHITGAPGSVDAAERERGWRSELGAWSLPVQEPAAGTWTPASGYAVGAELIRLGRLGVRGSTAVFSANDQMAVGLLHALEDAAVDVPREVSVVGFDDIPESAHLSPPLTTMRQDFEDLGSRMMAVLLAALGGDVALRPVQGLPRLMVRSSTAPPPGTESEQ